MEEVIRFCGTGASKRASIFVGFALISHILHEFTPFNSPITVDVDLGEERYGPIE